MQEKINKGNWSEEVVNTCVLGVRGSLYFCQFAFVVLSCIKHLNVYLFCIPEETQWLSISTSI